MTDTSKQNDRHLASNKDCNFNGNSKTVKQAQSKKDFNQTKHRSRSVEVRFKSIGAFLGTHQQKPSINQYSSSKQLPSSEKILNKNETLHDSQSYLIKSHQTNGNDNERLIIMMRTKLLRLRAEC